MFVEGVLRRQLQALSRAQVKGVFSRMDVATFPNPHFYYKYIISFFTNLAALYPPFYMSTLNLVHGSTRALIDFTLGKLFDLEHNRIKNENYLTKYNTTYDSNYRYLYY